MWDRAYLSVYLHHLITFVTKRSDADIHSSMLDTKPSTRTLTPLPSPGQECASSASLVLLFVPHTTTTCPGWWSEANRSATYHNSSSMSSSGSSRIFSRKYHVVIAFHFPKTDPPLALQYALRPPFGWRGPLPSAGPKTKKAPQIQPIVMNEILRYALCPENVVANGKL